MIFEFVPIRVLDVIDILLVALIMYQIYRMIKGTSAMSIFVGIIIFSAVWLLVTFLKMELLGSIMSSIISVGVIAIIILFQQELRKFLFLLGTRYFPNTNFALAQFFSMGSSAISTVRYRSIFKACLNLSQKKVGALIVIKRKSALDMYVQTGEKMNAATSNRLLEAIFNKTSPLHDGAVIVENDMIISASSVLPVSESSNIPNHLGLRHRAAIGLAEKTDALVIIVSEETGHISVAENGRLAEDLDSKNLLQILERELNIQA